MLRRLAQTAASGLRVAQAAASACSEAACSSHAGWTRCIATSTHSNCPLSSSSSWGGLHRRGLWHPWRTPQQPGVGLSWQLQRGMATVTARKAAGNAGLKFWKPTSPGQRFRVTIRRTGIWKGHPMRALTRGEKHHGGRNATGRITCRHRGGAAHRKKLRLVDFERRAAAPGVVERLEYDPGRTGYIALVKYPEGSVKGQQHGYSYILAPTGLTPGDTVQSGEGAPIKPGNTLPLKDIPVGMPIHSIELAPGHGGTLARAAGCMASIVNKQERHAIVRLPSGEQRLLSLNCKATIGAVSNPQNKNRVLGKAGHSRHLGIRPTVRGVAMNPIDHPHGGSTSGGRPSVSPWGLPTKSGYKTRQRHKPSSKFILVRRPRRFA